VRPSDPGADPPAGVFSYDAGWKPAHQPAPPDEGALFSAPDEAVRRRPARGGRPGGMPGRRRSADASRAADSTGQPGSAGVGPSGMSAEGTRAAAERGKSRGPRRESARGSRAATPGHPEDAPGDPESVARAICLRLLTLQPRTRAELAAALANRGVPDDAAGTVLSRFTEVGLIDDRAFAAAWVDSRHAGRGLSRRALASELRRRGVDGEIVGEAVAVVDTEAEERAARQLVDRRLASTRRLDQPARVRRLAGMLARKGYPGALAMRVVREALAAEGADPGDLDGWEDPPAED
jgi:regulatory protein